MTVLLDRKTEHMQILFLREEMTEEGVMGTFKNLSSRAVAAEQLYF